MKHFINLLPFEYRRRELLWRRFLQWSLVWTVCAIWVLGVWWLKQNRYRGALHAMKQAECSYLPLHKLTRERDVKRAELRELHAKGTLLGQLQEERPLLTLMGVVSENARKCNGRLVIRNMSFQRHKPRAETDARKPEQTKKKGQQSPAGKALAWATVGFEGDALDNLAIATFAAGLRDTGLFRRVELKSSVGKKSPGTKLRSFFVECDI